MRRSCLCLCLLAGALLVLVAAPAAHAQHSVARQWNEATLDAIRIDIPKPTVHARNLFHVSIGMWDAWAAYDLTANGYLVHEKHTADDVGAARNEAISYAAYRVLKHRYRYGPGEIPSQQSFDDLMDALGYDKEFTSTEGDSPAALGNRIGAAIIEYGLSDGANEGPFLQYHDDTGYAPVNYELIFDLPGTEMADPNRWQPLAFDYLILQNGIIIGAAIQEFLSPNWGKVEPFALLPEEQTFPWVYLDPGPPPYLDGVGDEQFRANVVQLIRLSSQVDPADGVMMDIGPGAIHNNPLGTHDGTGRAINPYTGEPYEPNIVPRADYGRVIAEFWADGPHSETPPGHWNTLANYVTDHPLLERRLGGGGRELGLLEWEVKLYIALNGAVHDAAIGAWGSKGYYDYSRPISHIRYMGGYGQSSDPDGPSYHPLGLPLDPGLIEVITEETAQPGERHEHLADYIGELAILAWQGDPEDPETEIGGVGWIRAVEWMPYQRDTFVTPPFAGYISGHSTFSRAAAEVLAALTGTEYFPGGMGIFVAHAGEYLEFEYGPTQTVELQWATYYDAADEAGISRLWGGIHPAADDFPGRIMGSTIGMKAWLRALELYGDGKATVCHIPPGNPDNAHTIRIGPRAVPAHMRHGDVIGPCEGAEEPDPGESAIGATPGREPENRIRTQLVTSATGRGPQADRARRALLDALATTDDARTRFTVVRQLADQVDPALNKFLADHLQDIRDQARDEGRPELAAQAERLLRKIESDGRR
jgi:hypothetical protein